MPAVYPNGTGERGRVARCRSDERPTVYQHRAKSERPVRRCPVCQNRHAAGPCEPHLDARNVGRQDAERGLPFDSRRWPSGVYGHADYTMGYYGSG